MFATLFQTCMTNKQPKRHVKNPSVFYAVFAFLLITKMKKANISKQFIFPFDL